MSNQNKRGDSLWKHPIPVALLNQYNYEKSIGEIIEAESAQFLADIAKESSGVISNASIPTPIESIASFLNVRIAYVSSRSNFEATAKQIGKEFEVTHAKNNQHYFRMRFSLAHEISHILLRRWAGPLNYDEILETKDTGYEEEALCDMLASALLLPKNVMYPYLQRNEAIIPSLIYDIARDFKVSKSVALKRVAELKNCVLLFWDDIRNPKRKDSERVERIIRIYKPSAYLSFYIPLYCTPNDIRFIPNLVLQSYKQQESSFGKVKISNLGSIPTGHYIIHNLFFQLWTEDLIKEGLAEKRQQFFNMASLIEMGTSSLQ